jgi:hypothetical protein
MSTFSANQHNGGAPFARPQNAASSTVASYATGPMGPPARGPYFAVANGDESRAFPAIGLAGSSPSNQRYRANNVAHMHGAATSGPVGDQPLAGALSFHNVEGNQSYHGGGGGPFSDGSVSHFPSVDDGSSFSGLGGMHPFASGNPNVPYMTDGFDGGVNGHIMSGGPIAPAGHVDQLVAQSPVPQDEFYQGFSNEFADMVNSLDAGAPPPAYGDAGAGSRAGAQQRANGAHFDHAYNNDQQQQHQHQHQQHQHQHQHQQQHQQHMSFGDAQAYVDPMHLVTPDIPRPGVPTVATHTSFAPNGLPVRNSYHLLQHGTNGAQLLDDIPPPAPIRQHDEKQEVHRQVLPFLKHLRVMASALPTSMVPIWYQTLEVFVSSQIEHGYPSLPVSAPISLRRVIC